MSINGAEAAPWTEVQTEVLSTGAGFAGVFGVWLEP